VERLAKSSYDPGLGTVVFETRAFQLQPDTGMTRGMFVTAATFADNAQISGWASVLPAKKPPGRPLTPTMGITV